MTDTSTVTVKPLVFTARDEALPDGAHLAADCGFGRYYISDRGEHGFGWKRAGAYVFQGFEPTEERAKAAAQADYERRIRSALAPHTPAQAALSLRNIEPDDGFWRSCSGCHETIDGQETGWYPYSPIFKCHLGAGCRECGGLGAVWDDTDYEDLAEFLLSSEDDELSAIADERADGPFVDVDLEPQTPAQAARVLIDELTPHLDALPAGPWETWTSNSFRRIGGPDGRDGGVLHAYTQRSDGHPDLSWTEEECEAICAIVNRLRAIAGGE